jgi:hypothetical protein
MAVDDRAWCYYRNLVHTVYREIRHIGASGDPEARLRVDEESLGREIANIRKWRSRLKTTALFDKIANKRSTASIRAPYEEVTGLQLDQLAALFGRPGWDRYYGGEKWKRIVELTLQLGTAIDADDGRGANALCEEISTIEHNSGRLVPRRSDEHNREKWPVLCDGLAPE